MKFIRTAAARFRRDRGQTLVTFVFFLLALILFVGLVIDVGFAYLTRASLSKAVDAASLTGARNLSFGKAQAETLAKAAFFANYPQSGREVAKPEPQITFDRNLDNNTVINVAASATIHTFFIGVLPQWKTLTVASSGQALRIKLIMDLVLDRSASMWDNGGAAELPDAVSTFIDNFDESKDRDRVGLASFASYATTDPNSPYVPIEQPFKTDIKNAASRWLDENLFLTGGRFTFADGGLTLATNAFRNVPLADGENVARVVVFFTDGNPNTFQDSFACTAPQPLNFAATDTPLPGRGRGYFVDPSNGEVVRCPSDPQCGFTLDLDTVGAPRVCPIISFNSVDQMEPVKTVNWFNVHDEGRLRALATAKALRRDKDGPITIYAIGLGNVKEEFLKSLANDRTATDFNSHEPEGVAVLAPTDQELKAAFQTIASKILLRLTR